MDDEQCASCDCAEPWTPRHSLEVEDCEILLGKIDKDRKFSSVTMETTFPSTVNTNESDSGILTDLWQTQLALWTFTFSTVFTRLWQKRVRFINSLTFAVASVAIATVISGLLAFLVVVAHIFGRKVSPANGSSLADSIDGWVSPRRQRSLSISSYCSDIRSRHSSGAKSPIAAGARSPVYKNQPVFWERKMSMEQNYFGRSSRC